MTFSGNFGKIDPRLDLTFLKSPSLLSGNFKKRQNELRAIYPKLRHTITNTNDGGS